MKLTPPALPHLLGALLCAVVTTLSGCGGAQLTADAPNETRRFELICAEGTVVTLQRARPTLLSNPRRPVWEWVCRTSSGRADGPVIQVRSRLRRSQRMREAPRRRLRIPRSLVIRTGRYRDNQLDGEWVQYRPDGTTLGSFKLVDGTGLARTWHDNGELASEGRLEGGVRHGRWRHVYSDGTPELLCSYHGGKRHGLWRSWYANGQPKKFVSYERGERQGLYTRWWSSGNKRREGLYRAGKRDGRWFFWSPSGQLLGVNHLKDGSGQWTVWSTSGALASRGPMVAGERHGLWTVYHSDGTVHSSGQFNHGRRLSRTWRRTQRPRRSGRSPMTLRRFGSHSKPGAIGHAVGGRLSGRAGLLTRLGRKVSVSLSMRSLSLGPTTPTSAGRRRLLNDFRRCAQYALRSASAPGQSVSMRAVIRAELHANGGVAQAQMITTGPTLTKPAMRRCVLAAVRGARFVPYALGKRRRLILELKATAQLGP